MEQITENEIEKFANELFEKLGYLFIYAPDIARTAKRPCP